MASNLPPDKLEIEDQLNRILLFPVFANSQILSGFLSFIVEETLSGRSNQLKEYTIGTYVLSKKNGYNPQADASVRIHAGRLRRALYNYYSGPGSNDPILISVDKGSYIPKFEKVSPETLQLDSTGPYVFYKPALAVFPFTVNEDQSLMSLADGLCDQICTELTSFNELSVISYYSSKRLASQIKDLKEVKQLLDVSYILTGSIQSGGGLVRIRVQLIKTDTLYQVWSNTYEKSIDLLNAFDIQDDVVHHVVNQIAGSHGIIVRDTTKILPIQQVLDIKVYDAVFWYYYLVNGPTEEIYTKALDSMKQAVQIDSNYALGWAILSETYVAGYFYNYDCQTVNPLEEAIRCGKESLRIDLHCQHAYQSLGLAYLFSHKQKECLQIIEQWIKLKSNSASIAGGLGFCLICLGHYERGYTMLHDSIQLNPYYQWWFNAGLSIYHFENKDFEEAIYWVDKMQRRSPHWDLILRAASYVNLNQGNQAQLALGELKMLLPDYDNQIKPLLGTFLHSNELIDKLWNALQRVELVDPKLTVN